MADEISFPPFAPVGGGLGNRAIRNLVIDARDSAGVFQTVLLRSRGYVGAVLMWYGYVFEAIYIVLGTVLTATVLGILIYH